MSPLKTLLTGGILFIASLIMFFTGRLAANLGAGYGTVFLWMSLLLFIGSILFLILYIKKINLK
jgi:hypothetical protein